MHRQIASYAQLDGRVADDVGEPCIPSRCHPVLHVLLTVKVRPGPEKSSSSLLPCAMLGWEAEHRVRRPLCIAFHRPWLMVKALSYHP